MVLGVSTSSDERFARARHDVMPTPPLMPARPLAPPEPPSPRRT
jgi:hypothetical protein